MRATVWRHRPTSSRPSKRTGRYPFETSSDDLAHATSAQFTITAPPTQVIVRVSPPATVTAGQPISPAVQVAVADENGDTVPSAVANITVSLAEDTATLTGTMMVPTVNGVAQFTNLRVDKVGTAYHLLATGVLVSTQASLDPDTSTPFDVAPGAPHHLGFRQEPPATAVAGVALAPAVKVEVLDDQGNF